MKIFFTSILILPALFSVKAQGFKVTLHTPSFTNGLAYLTYYYGKNINIEDSAIISPKGIAVFQKNEKLQPGVYSIVFPGKNKMCDFLVDKEQVIDIKSDTTDLINKTVVTGSKENVLFQQYQKFINAKGNELQTELNAYKSSGTKEDSTFHEEKYNALNKEMNDYRDKIIQEHPESMLAALLLAMKEPKTLIKKPATHEDSLENYYYYKKHYWDGISFMDDRIIRTPFFIPKLEKYFREVLSPAPDSIIKESDYLLLRARVAPEMYKFLLNWFTDEYIYPKYMGQDAVFVHLFETYHSKGVSSWLTEKQLTIISNRAYMLMANLIGEQAANLELTDSTGKITPLYDMEAPYTIVCFWDPTCSHCREQVPELDSMYHAKWEKEGVKIYGVLTDSKVLDQWKQFMVKNNLRSWINVYQTEEQGKAVEDAKKPSFKQLYDVTQTPTLYLLDKDKRIIAKKLTIQQMDDVLQMKISGKPLTSVSNQSK
ncbi:MAG TPA: redoxin domain-containing protein [Chitinophagaceae bacterium]|nr:redoxin domain-containing protein [Chitinophagaceae bacterium]